MLTVKNPTGTPKGVRSGGRHVVAAPGKSIEVDGYGWTDGYRAKLEAAGLEITDAKAKTTEPADAKADTPEEGTAAPKSKRRTKGE